MKLEDAKMLSKCEINQNEVLFVSDIEHFSLKVKQSLLDKIKKEKLKAVVFVGDILSGFSTLDSSYRIFQESPTAFEMFYDVKKIIKKYSRKERDEFDIARAYIGRDVSNRLSKRYAKELTSFKLFIRECNKEDIPVVFFSGNHDSLLSWENFSDERFIPILDEIHSLKGLKIPYNFELMKLNNNLYLMGIHTSEDKIEKYEFFRIKEILEKLNENIESPEKIIFVSHIPGIKKFSKLGSQDISNLKKRFKFKYHYHGHVKNYHDEYDEDI